MTLKTPDTNGVERLTAATCWRLLKKADLGRLAVAGNDGVPELFPVNYAVRGTRLYIRTAPGAKLAHVASTAAVAFEVDGADGVHRWSVIVHATAGALRLIEDTSLDTVATAHPTEKSVLVELVPTGISGRRFRDARLRGRRPVFEPVPHETPDRKPVPIPHFPPAASGDRSSEN